jgi:hypothetical protein
MRTSAWSRVAAVVVAVEGIALVALVFWQIVALVTGDTGVLTTALALLVLSAVFAAAVLGFAVAIWRGLTWGRSGGIVTQLLILAIALGAVTGEYAHPLVALALAAPAVLALLALVFAVRAEARAERAADVE